MILVCIIYEKVAIMSLRQDLLAEITNIDSLLCYILHEMLCNDKMIRKIYSWVLQVLQSKSLFTSYFIVFINQIVLSVIKNFPFGKPNLLSFAHLVIQLVYTSQTDDICNGQVRTNVEIVVIAHSINKLQLRFISCILKYFLIFSSLFLFGLLFKVELLQLFH